MATLTADLEKERSKVHALKLELDKVKVGQSLNMCLCVSLYVCVFACLSVCECVCGVFGSVCVCDVCVIVCGMCVSCFLH